MHPNRTGSPNRYRLTNNMFNIRDVTNYQRQSPPTLVVIEVSIVRWTRVRFGAAMIKSAIEAIFRHALAKPIRSVCYLTIIHYLVETTSKAFRAISSRNIYHCFSSDQLNQCAAISGNQRKNMTSVVISRSLLTGLASAVLMVSARSAAEI